MLSHCLLLTDEASNGDINEGWPAKDTSKKLHKWKLNVVIEPNVHNITMTHFQKPLCKLSKEESQYVLELLGTKKIQMTYTGKKLDRSAINNNRCKKKQKRVGNSVGDSTPGTGSVATSAAADGSQSQATNTADRTKSQSVSTEDGTTNNLNGQAASTADGRPKGSGGSSKQV
jgi:hypothetical protein